MRAFYSDHFVLPLPEGHKFPMAKYARLRERIVADAIVAPEDLHGLAISDTAALTIARTIVSRASVNSSWTSP